MQRTLALAQPSKLGLLPAQSKNTGEKDVPSGYIFSLQLLHLILAKRLRRYDRTVDSKRQLGHNTILRYGLSESALFEV